MKMLKKQQEEICEENNYKNQRRAKTRKNTLKSKAKKAGTEAIEQTVAKLKTECKKYKK